MNDAKFLEANGVDVNHGLELLGDMEMYNSIMVEFQKGYDMRMAKIKAYKEANDMVNYAIEVHALKSDSKYLGFMNLADLAYKHEMSSKANDIKSVNAHYNELINEANRIKLVIDKYLTVEDESTVVSFDDINKALTEISPLPTVTPIPEAAPIDENLIVPTTGGISNELNNDALAPSVPTCKSILVADDSSIIRNFVKEIFSSEYNVLTASDGKEVINLVNDKTNKIIAMLLDLNMPGVSGFDVLEYFKENELFSKIPVSIISGASDKESIDKAFEYPIIDMLNKPFGRENVKMVVQKTVDYGDII